MERGLSAHRACAGIYTHLHILCTSSNIPTPSPTFPPFDHFQGNRPNDMSLGNGRTSTWSQSRRRNSTHTAPRPGYNLGCWSIEAATSLTATLSVSLPCLNCWVDDPSQPSSGDPHHHGSQSSASSMYFKWCRGTFECNWSCKDNELRQHQGWRADNLLMNQPHLWTSCCNTSVKLSRCAQAIKRLH